MMHRSKIVLVLAAAFATTAGAQQPAPPVQAQAPAPAQPPAAPMGGVNFQNASLTEVIDQLAR